MQAQQHIKPPVSLSADPMNPSSGCQAAWPSGQQFLFLVRTLFRPPVRSIVLEPQNRVGRILRVACKARQGEAAITAAGGTAGCYTW